MGEDYADPAAMGRSLPVDSADVAAIGAVGVVWLAAAGESVVRARGSLVALEGTMSQQYPGQPAGGGGMPPGYGGAPPASGGNPPGQGAASSATGGGMPPAPGNAPPPGIAGGPPQGYGGPPPGYGGPPPSAPMPGQNPGGSAQPPQSKRLLLVAGIGCGLVLLLGIAAAVASVFWLKARGNAAVEELQRLQTSATALPAGVEPPLAGDCLIAFRCCQAIASKSPAGAAAAQACDVFKTPGYPASICSGALTGYRKVAEQTGVKCD